MKRKKFLIAIVIIVIHLLVVAAVMITPKPPDTTSKSYSQDLLELKSYWGHMHAASDHYQAKRFDAAEDEIQLAIKKSRSENDVWVARSLRKRVLKASGDLEAAIREIDWLYANNKKEDVRKKLLKEKRDISQ
jgi:hypothetical protein